MSLRKIIFYVRAYQKRGKTFVVRRFYGTKKAATAAKRKGEHVVMAEGFYWREDGLVMNRRGKWVKSI